MRALTVKQPWAWAITHAGKNVENRSRPIPKIRCDRCNGGGMIAPGDWCQECGGSGVFDVEDDSIRVALHAGKAWDDSAWTADLPGGAFVIDKANDGSNHLRGLDPDGYWKRQPFGAIVAVIELTSCNPEDYLFDPSPWAQYSNEGEPEIWHWHIGDVTPLADPISCRGMLGLWTVPDDVERQIRAQTA